MKKNRFVILSSILCAVAVMVSVAACSADEAMYDMDPFDGNFYAETTVANTYSAAADAVYEMEAVGKNYKSDYSPADTAPPVETTNASEAPKQDSARKLIKNVTLELETKEFDPFVNSLDAQIAAVGGYVESSSIRGSGMHRSANMTARIPADRLDEFCTGVSERANVIMRTENTQDVTLTYYDMESHMKALRTEYDTLVGILEKCTELKDVITVQSRITEVLYQIESYKTQLNNYDSLVSYSTVRIYVNEVERETVVEKQTLGSRIGDAFGRTLDDIRIGAEDFTVDLIANSPYILFWIVLIVVCIFGVRKGIRRWKKKHPVKPTEE